MTSPDQSPQPFDVDADVKEVHSLGSEIKTTLCPSPQSSANKRKSEALLGDAGRGSNIASKKLRPAGGRQRSKGKAGTARSASLGDERPSDPSPTVECGAEYCAFHPKATKEGLRLQTTPFRVPPSSIFACFPCRKQDLKTKLSCNGVVLCNSCSTQGLSSECRPFKAKWCDACYAVKVKCNGRIPCKACVKMDLGNTCTPFVPKFMKTGQQPNNDNAEDAGGLAEAHAEHASDNHVQAPMQHMPPSQQMQQPDMCQQNGFPDFNTGETFNLDFSTLDNAGFGEAFDFDSFLNTTTDDSFAFDSGMTDGDFSIDVYSDGSDGVPRSRTLANGWRSTVAAPQPKSDIVRPSPRGRQRRA